MMLRHTAALLAVLCAAACSGTAQTGGPPPSASTSALPSAVPSQPPPPGELERELLGRAVAEEQSLGAGSGRLGSVVHNEQPGFPATAERVTLVFACTGPATVKLTVELDQLRAATGTHKCGDPMFQTTFPAPKAKVVGFTADPSVLGGEFAYAFLAREGTAR
jgi:hypothetical protein